MRVLIAGASGALGTPLTRQLLAAGREVIGLSRTPGNRDKLLALGAEPVIADAMDRVPLLQTIDGLEADAIVRQLTALKKLPMRHASMAALERGRPGQAYNVVDDEPVSWRRFLGTLAEAFGTPPPWEVPRWLFRLMPYAAAMMTSTLRVSNAKAERELGWTLSTPAYCDGIRRMTAFHNNAA